MGLIRNSRDFSMSGNNEKRKCVDCLHCKVSSCSTRNSRLCFCSKDSRTEGSNKIYDLESYWLFKKVCKKFEDMAC